MAEEGLPGSKPPDAPTVLGRYRLEKRLGEGGMGYVYEAVHEELGKRVAIKTLKPHYSRSEESRQRFLREGRAAAKIHHRNVADVYDVSIDGDPPYLVLELVEGETLAQLLSRSAPLPAQKTADLVVPVVAALAVAHDLGVVHRDLKPENIYLSQVGSAIVPKVLDFGISKLTQDDSLESLTASGAVLGTPHFMSPEQVLAMSSCDARSDQYSLGAILYQCVTGRRPNEGTPLYSLLQRTVLGEFPKPTELEPGVPSQFEALVLRAMALRPENRFASARELGMALLSFASSRVREEYEAELQAAPHQAARSAPLESGRSEAPMMLSTTLGESVGVRLPTTVTVPLRHVSGALGITLLLVVGVTGFWLRGGEPGRPAAPAVSALCRPPVGRKADDPGALASRWSCLAAEPVGGKRELDPSQMVQYRLWIRNMTTGKGLSGVSVRVCHALDVDCADPHVEHTTPDAHGYVTLELPANFEGVAEIQPGADDIVPQLQALQIPPDSGPTLQGQWNLVLRRDLRAWMGANGAHWQEATHCLMAMVVYNCWGERAAGVRFFSDSGGSSYYFSNGFPSATAKETDWQGLGGIIDLPAGKVSVEARVADDGRSIVRREWSCRAGWINSLSLMPPACPLQSLFGESAPDP